MKKEMEVTGAIKIADKLDIIELLVRQVSALVATTAHVVEVSSKILSLSRRGCIATWKLIAAKRQTWQRRRLSEGSHERHRRAASENRATSIGDINYEKTASGSSPPPRPQFSTPCSPRCSGARRRKIFSRRSPRARRGRSGRSAAG